MGLRVCMCSPRLIWWTATSAGRWEMVMQVVFSSLVSTLHSRFSIFQTKNNAPIKWAAATSSTRIWLVTSSCN